MYLALGCESLTLHSLLCTLTPEGMTDWSKLRSLCKVRKILRELEPREPGIERPITVCFHRAFDMTRSAIEGMSIALRGDGFHVDGSDALCTSI